MIGAASNNNAGGGGYVTTTNVTTTGREPALGYEESFSSAGVDQVNMPEGGDQQNMLDTSQYTTAP